MRKKTTKSLLLIVTMGFFAACTGDVSKKLEDKLNKLDSKAQSLDSIVNKEVNRVKNLDSIINLESEKIKKLDSVVNKSSSKIDSVVGGKIDLLKEIIK